MESKKKHTFTLFITVLLFLIALVAFVTFAMKLKYEIERTEQVTKDFNAKTKKHNQLSNTVAQKKERHDRLLFDDEFLIRIIKEKFGYTQPDELVFKFKDGEIATENEDTIK